MMQIKNLMPNSYLLPYVPGVVGIGILAMNARLFGQEMRVTQAKITILSTLIQEFNDIQKPLKDRIDASIERLQKEFKREIAKQRNVVYEGPLLEEEQELLNLLEKIDGEIFQNEEDEQDDDSVIEPLTLSQDEVIGSRDRDMQAFASQVGKLLNRYGISVQQGDKVLEALEKPLEVYKNSIKMMNLLLYNKPVRYMGMGLLGIVVAICQVWRGTTRR